MFDKFRCTLRSVLAVAVGAMILPHLGAGAAEKPSFEAIRHRIVSTTGTVALARANSTTVTNQVLRHWLEIAKPKRYDTYSADQILSLPGKDLADVISELAFYVMARAEALKDADFATTSLPEMLARQREQALLERYLEKEVIEKNPPMNDTEARKWYEENLSLYTQPATFSVRVIFLSTYRPFLVRKGESGGQIARDVIGDPKAFNRILDRKTSAPLFAPTHPNAVADFAARRKDSPSLELLQFLPMIPPEDGQRVYIPMKEPERKAVKERLEKVAAQAKPGEEFIRLAKQHSDEPAEVRGSTVGPLPTPGRPLLEPVLEAVQKTPVGRLTPILETPHGYLLMEIVSKNDRKVLPYKEVREKLISDEVGVRRKRARDALSAGLLKDPLLKINRGALMKDGAPDSLEIARVGDFRYTWGDYRRETGRRYSAPPTYEGRVQLLEGTPASEGSLLLRQQILLAKALEAGVESDPKVAGRLSGLETMLRGRAYLEWYAQARIPLSDEQLRRYYTEERDQFREPARYTLRELVYKLDPEDLKDAQKIEVLTTYYRDDIGKPIKSERTFTRQAAAHANWPARERDRGARQEVEENYRGPEFAKILSTLDAERCQGPYCVGDEIFLLWISERSPVRYRSFDEVKSQVEILYRSLHWDELMMTAEKEIRSRHQLEYLFTYGDKGSGARGQPTDAKSAP